MAGSVQASICDLAINILDIMTVTLEEGDCYTALTRVFLYLHTTVNRYWARVGCYSDEADAEPVIIRFRSHVLLFTSGSTGTPKGIILSHEIFVTCLE